MNKGILIVKSQFSATFTKKSISASKSRSEQQATDCNQLIAIF